MHNPCALGLAGRSPHAMISRVTGLCSRFATLASALLVLLCAAAARADVVVFDQPATASGGSHKSAWYSPDGLDSDEYAWDSFICTADTAVTRISWRGLYQYSANGFAHAPVSNFSVAIYRSIGGGFQPDLGTGGRLVRYYTNSNASEVGSGTIAGLPVYDYTFTLPAPFQATAGTKYWVQIEASQGLAPGTYWPPDWALCNATGTGGYFRKITGGTYQAISGDCAFTLYASSAPAVNIAATPDPADAGTILGAGSYPIGSTVSLTATANTGFAFVNWTDGASQVSTNAHYTFTASVARSLVAHFNPAYTIHTATYPTWGGTVTGAGIYAAGATVTLTATPAHGFEFSSWSNGETTPTIQFPTEYDLWETAMFVPAPGASPFDFDDAPIFTSLPLALSSNGLGAYFDGGFYNYSIQHANAYGFTPSGFDGRSIYPNAVFLQDLSIDFDQPIVDFSILYGADELGCDDSSIMRATAFLDGVEVATNTATVPVPGTYPTGTLGVVEPGGFDRVVIHYDRAPTRCQDYGVIFWLDNMMAIRPIQPCPTCAADFDANGGIDGADLAAFFTDYEAGAECADVDQNGGIDGADLATFFGVYEAGGC